jgi:hypothetical protein
MGNVITAKGSTLGKSLHGSRFTSIHAARGKSGEVSKKVENS